MVTVNRARPDRPDHRLFCPSALLFAYTAGGRRHHILLSFAVPGGDMMTSLKIYGKRGGVWSWSGWIPVAWQCVLPEAPSPTSQTKWVVHINYQGDMAALRRRVVWATGDPTAPVGAKMWNPWSGGSLWVDISMVTLPMADKQLAGVAGVGGSVCVGGSVSEVPSVEKTVRVQVVEKIVEVPVPVFIEVYKYKVEVVEKIVEVPVEVPVKVPVVVEKRVEVPVVVEKRVEVPVIVKVPETVEVPEISVAEDSWEVLEE